MKNLIMSVVVLAIFTGRSEMGQNLSHQTGWICEYQAQGRYFTLFFTSYCPSSVEVN